MRGPLFSLLALFASLAGCEKGPAPESAVEYRRFGLAEVVSFDLYREERRDRLHLLLAGPIAPGGARHLHYVYSDDNGRSWSAPVRLGAGQPAPVPVKRGNDVQIAAAGEHILALWQTAGTGFAGAGPMVTALSADGGARWSPGPNPAADESREGHAFADLVADRAGRFHLVWLDSRGVVQAADGTKRVAAGSGRQGLMYARSPDGGRTWTGHARIDSATCECCWNSLRATADGRLLVLYRDIDPRDMALAVSADGGRRWERRGRVGAFGWAFDGCPHVGGGLAASGGSGGEDGLVATVWTGKAEAAGLYALTREAAAPGWSSPVLLDARARHSDLAALPGGGAIAVWDSYGDSGPAVFAARREADTARWSAPRRLSAPGPAASHPRVAAGHEAATVIWTAERKREDGSAALATAIAVLPLE